jgi:hypothetical protein
MNVIPTQNVWFDDAATLAMGEAFDNACKSLQNFGSAVPAIIADLIIAGAKNGERDPARLAIIIFAIEDTSMPLVSVVGSSRSPTTELEIRPASLLNQKLGLAPASSTHLPNNSTPRLKL